MTRWRNWRMSEQVGVLDGLRDIVQPSAPIVHDWFWYYVASIVVIMLTLTLLAIVRYQKHPTVCAKKIFRFLRDNWSELQAQECGEHVISILRLALQQQNISEKKYLDCDSPLDQKQWEWLMLQCNQLRFSVSKTKPEDAVNILPLIEKILWQNH